MQTYQLPFEFVEGDSLRVAGLLELGQPASFNLGAGLIGFYRTGRLVLEGGGEVDLALYSTPATNAFIYTRCCQVDQNLLKITGLSDDEVAKIRSIRLPGQLCMGSDRTHLIGQAVSGLFQSPLMRHVIGTHRQENLAVFPIAREGLKYEVADALFAQYGFYCDEVVLDAHHVFDISVPVYNRKVELTLFKDKDLDQAQHQKIKVAFLADSIASGMVMKEVILKVKERFENLEQVEVVSPLTTLRGLSRIARGDPGRDYRVRVHIFETILNALPPDYYYSAHFDVPEMHIRPELESEYRLWWGKDEAGNWIADTACAGYGWSEVFYSPRKQIEMINSQLTARHGLTIDQVIRRNL